jgi:transposase
MSNGEKQAGRPRLHALERAGTPARTSTTLSIARPPQPSATPAAAAAPSGDPAPDPEVVERPGRRSFTAEFKRRIVEEADACTSPGEVGALLRRHGLYSSHLADWRMQYRLGVLGGLGPRRGPKPTRNPLARRVAQLEREKARLQKQLTRAKIVIAVQKKASELLGIPLTRPGDDEND